MKVVILTATSAWGGVEVHAIALAEVLADRQHRVVVAELGHCVYSERNLSLNPNIEIVTIATSKPLEKLNIFALAPLLTPLKSDVIVFEKGDLDAGNFTLDCVARFYSRRYITIEQLSCVGTPPMLTRTSTALGGGLGWWQYRSVLQRWSRGLNPNAVVCVGEAVRTALLEQHRFPPKKTITIANGINPDRFQRIPEVRRRVRQEWRVPSDAFVFGAVGRLAPVKGYDIALDTFRELMSAHRERNLWLVLVGDGPSRRELQDRALELGIGDRVCFPGFTDRPWESYAALDVFLMPSVTEGLPHSLLEAMASLCVPIAMAVAAIPEVLNKKGLGWLVTPGDRKAFGDAMRDAACAGSAKLAEIGRLGRQRIEQHFNSKIQLMRLADLIERESFRNVAVSFQNPRSSTPTPSPTGL